MATEVPVPAEALAVGEEDGGTRGMSGISMIIFATLSLGLSSPPSSAAAAAGSGPSPGRPAGRPTSWTSSRPREAACRCTSSRNCSPRWPGA